MSSNVADRVSARIFDPASDGELDIRFVYEHPFISSQSDPKTATHEVIDGPDVTQHFGAKTRSFTARGTCYLDEANQIDTLRRHERVAVRSERYSGPAVVTSAFTDPAGSGGGERSGVENRTYTYRIEFREVL
jgi:hypothetical protein